MRKILFLLIGIVSLMVYTSCEYTDIVPDDGSGVVVSGDVSFSTDVEPIFKAQSCTNCHPAMHQPDLAAGKAYKSLVDGGFLNTKKPGDSKIVNEPAPSSTHAAKLTTGQVSIIVAWIEQGAKDN